MLTLNAYGFSVVRVRQNELMLFFKHTLHSINGLFVRFNILQEFIFLLFDN